MHQHHRQLPLEKLRLVHKHDLTVSHSSFSPRLPNPPRPTNVTTLITVIPPASFPLSPCVYPFTPSPLHLSTFRSKCSSIRKDAETTTPLSLYPFIHQRCADEVGEKKKKSPHTVEKFSFASDSPLTSLTPVIVYILTPLALRGKVPKTSWSHHIGKILTYVSLITYTPLLLFPFHSCLFLHPNCPCLGCC